MTPPEQTEFYHWVFIWNGDPKPAEHHLRHLSVVSRPVRYINVTTLSEAKMIFDTLGKTCAQYWHTVSVPHNALEYFGGEVIDGIKK